MAIGAGKYDDLTTRAREAAEAECAILIILRGNKGDGFSVQAPLPIVAGLPELLRIMANQIEADLHAPAGRACRSGPI